MNASEHYAATTSTIWSGVDWGQDDDLELVDLSLLPPSPPTTLSPTSQTRPPRTPRRRRTQRAAAACVPIPAGRARTARPAPATPSHAATHLLLIDLENIGATPARPLRARLLLEALLRAAPTADRVVAVAAPRMLEPQRELLAALGIESHVVRTGPDAADLRLLEIARAETRRGCAKITVASADHCFATLADLCELHVIERAGHPVSKALRARALSLTLAA